MKFSLLYCVYNNQQQFRNSLWTAINQKTKKPYEIIVIDNATPNKSILDVTSQTNKSDFYDVRYLRIANEDKRCTNITQGTNLAAQYAVGKYIIIVADSNVLLSFNLLEKIDELIDEHTLVLSSGPSNDVKISPGGTKQSEYGEVPNDRAAEINNFLLVKMGWPNDPRKLKLRKGNYRFPPPHMMRDCYIAAMPREYFLSYGGYDESKTQWGPYHEFFLDNMSRFLKKEKHLTGVRIIHQYHQVMKEQTV